MKNVAKAIAPDDDRGSGNVIDIREELTREQAANRPTSLQRLDDGLGTMLHDARVRGEVTAEWVVLLDRPMTLLLPSNLRRDAKQTKWCNSTAPFRGWLEGDAKGGLSHHMVKTKKGYFPIVFGASVSDDRKIVDMVTVDCMALDVDSGDNYNAALDRCEDLGLAVIGYTSHSNGATESAKLRDPIRKAIGCTTDLTDEDLRDYLASTGKYTEEHIASVSITEQTAHRTGGLHIVYSHSPLEKFRLVFPLAAPVSVAKLAPTQKASLEVFASKVRGLGQLIGVRMDDSCTEPSRAFYLPSHREDAVFALDIVRGRGLTIEELPEVGKGGSKNAFEIAGGNSGPVVETLSGLNLKGWAVTHGKRLEIARLLEGEASDKVRADKGGLLVVECPYDHEHSNAGDSDDPACHVRDADGDVGFAWKCKHDSCANHDRLDMLAKALADGWFEETALSDDNYLVPLSDEELAEQEAAANAFSHLMPLATPEDVAATFYAHEELDDEIRAALCAGVILAKNKDKARAKLEELLGGTKRDREKHFKAGEAYLVTAEAAKKSVATVAFDHRAETFKVSLEVSAPLGFTEAQKMASLDARFSLVNYRGKVVLIRNVDLAGIDAGDQLLEFWTKEAATHFYAHESWSEKIGSEVKVINPVDRWWFTHARRYSRVVFDPSEKANGTSVNLYDPAKRVLKPAEGDAKPITDFIHNVIADNDPIIFDFITLWLAHLVQRPWERPGTALVLYGKGGAGKGTFADIVRRLVAPYDLGISDKHHLTGQFAGPALATSLVVASEEAVYGKDPVIADKLKGMITQTTAMVEAKNFQAVQLNVFYRLIIDSNHEGAVRIEGNNAERRYLVSNVSDAMIGNAAAFEELRRHIDGPAMQAFLFNLMQYVPPADAGGWNSVRTAPETIYRKQMFVDTMRGADKEFLRMLDEGIFGWKDGDKTLQIVFNEEGENRLPAKALDDFVKQFSGKFESDLRPAAAVWKRLFDIELAKPKAARSQAEYREWVEGELGGKDRLATDTGYVWKPVALNTPMYHLPGLALIREMIRERTGLGSETAKSDEEEGA